MTDEAVLAECPRCGAPRADIDLIRRDGPVETYRCPECGAEYEVLVTPALGIDLDDTTYAVDVSWSADEPAAAVVKVLRELFPDLHALPLGQVRARVAQGPPLRREGLVRVQAEQFREAVRRQGLRADMHLESREG